MGSLSCAGRVLLGVVSEAVHLDTDSLLRIDEVRVDVSIWVEYRLDQLREAEVGLAGQLEDIHWGQNTGNPKDVLFIWFFVEKARLARVPATELKGLWVAALQQFTVDFDGEFSGHDAGHQNNGRTVSLGEVHEIVFNGSVLGGSIIETLILVVRADIKQVLLGGNSTHAGLEHLDLLLERAEKTGPFFDALLDLFFLLLSRIELGQLLEDFLGLGSFVLHSLGI